MKMNSLVGPACGWQDRTRDVGNISRDQAPDHRSKAPRSGNIETRSRHLGITRHARIFTDGIDPRLLDLRLPDMVAVQTQEARFPESV